MLTAGGLTIAAESWFAIAQDAINQAGAIPRYTAAELADGNSDDPTR